MIPGDIFAQAQQHHRAGHLAEAEAMYHWLYENDSGHSGAVYYLGAIATQRGDHAAAEKWTRRALVLNPRHVEAHYNLGVTLQMLERHAEAAASFRAALALQPQHVEAHNNLGVALQKQGQLSEAEAHYREAMRLDANYPEAYYNLGRVLQMQNRLDEAVAVFRQALALRPKDSVAHFNLGVALEALARPKEAIQCYRDALALQPDYLDAHTNLIFALNFDPDASLEDQQQERAQWDALHGRRFSNAIGRHDNSPEKDRRLRIGYVSAHFCRQAATYGFAAVLLNHDRERFEVYCYSDTAQEDEITARLRSSGAHWRAIANLSDDKVADMIRADAIDILVDLVGHMNGHRLLVFARKPAPIQVTGWGEPTGTGLRTMDYLFADPVLVPMSQRSLLSESVIDLPCFLSFWTPEELPAPAPLPAEKLGYVTFGSFNRATKISENVLRTWSSILRSLPTSRLVLKDRGYGALAQRERVSNILREEEISTERVTFLGLTSRAEHFAAYHNIDLALDPFPHSGGMTTLDALWMGVPVISCPGQTIPSRLAASILSALNLKDFIARDMQHYVKVATAMASQRDALARLRASFRAHIAGSPIGNPAYTLAVEKAYRTIWQRWCKVQEQT